MTRGTDNIDVAHQVGCPLLRSRKGVCTCKQKSKKSHETPTKTKRNYASPHIGFHAYKSAQGAFKSAGYEEAVVKVRIWGRVVEHKNGYRAQYMKLV